MVNPSRQLRQRAWYYSTLTVNPQNANDLWFPQVPLLHSIDGGKTLQILKDAPHGDHHDIWIDPLNPRRIIGANDGGVDPRRPTAARRGPHRRCPSRSSTTSASTPGRRTTSPARCRISARRRARASAAPGRLRLANWHGVGGGEAGYVVSDPSDPNIVYAGEYLGIITRYDHRTGQSHNVSAWPENPSGHGGEDMRYRFQWTAPIAASPHDAKVIYHGAQVVFRTTNGGQSWDVISPDLTRNDKARQKWAGGPITGDNTGVETYGTVFAIAESPKQAGVIWAGSDDGLVHVTRDGGKNWTNVTAAMPRPAGVGHGQPDRAVALRRRDRLRRRRRAPARRHAAVSVQDHRLRQDLDAARLRPCRRTSTCTPCARTRRGAVSSISAPSAA